MKILSLFLILILIFPTFSCKEDECIHNYVSETILEQTCLENGTKRYTCTICNAHYDEEIEASWHETNLNSLCTHCGAQIDSTLSCELSIDGTFYVIKEWLLQEPKSTLTLPKEWRNFSSTPYLPIKEIGEDVFSGNVFTEINLPPTITVLRRGSFANSTSLKSIVLPNKLTQINEDVFSSSTLLQTVYLPKSLTYVGKNAFNNCPFLKTVYYSGSIEDFNKIQIQDGNNALINATIIFDYKA